MRSRARCQGCWSRSKVWISLGTQQASWQVNTQLYTNQGTAIRLWASRKNSFHCISTSVIENGEEIIADKANGYYNSNKTHRHRTIFWKANIGEGVSSLEMLWSHEGGNGWWVLNTYRLYKGKLMWEISFKDSRLSRKSGSMEYYITVKKWTGVTGSRMDNG